MDAFTSSIAWEALLRLVGAFYALTAPLALRQAALSHLMMRALGLLGAAPPEERRAENARVAILCLNAVLIGLGGIWLVVLAQAAAWLFAVSAVLYGLYLAWIAPRWLDPHDPPEEPSRSQTRNAFFVYAAATALVLGAHARGLLTGVGELDRLPLWTALILSAALAAYAIHVFLPARSRPGEDRLATSAEGHMPVQSWTTAPAQRAILSPGWSRGGLIDAATRDPVTAIEGVELFDEDFDLIEAWNELFRSLADPGDPLRSALRDPARQPEIEAAGRAIYDDLLHRAGPERIGFEPAAQPQPPIVFPEAIRVMPDYGCSPLWHDGGRLVGDIRPDDLGLSWALARDLNEWALDFEEGIDWNDPGAAPIWTAEQDAEHHRRGAALAGRVSDELARTGRSGVRVRYAGNHPDAAG